MYFNFLSLSPQKAMKRFLENGWTISNNFQGQKVPKGKRKRRRLHSGLYLLSNIISIDSPRFQFNPCVRSMSLKRQPTARFADDCMLPPTAAYHTTSAPKLRKGPQSCPGGRDDFNAAAYSRSNKLPRTFPLGASSSSRQDFQIDDFERGSRNHKIRESSSMEFAKRDQKEGDDEDNEAMLERKSRYYMQKWENSEKQRREERRKQERYEQERESIQSVMSNMAYCMASAQQLEQLKKERDQYKKEMRRYKAKCEQLESKCEQLQTMSPSYGAFQVEFRGLHFFAYHICSKFFAKF